VAPVLVRAMAGDGAAAGGGELADRQARAGQAALDALGGALEQLDELPGAGVVAARAVLADVADEGRLAQGHAVDEPPAPRVADRAAALARGARARGRVAGRGRPGRRGGDRGRQR